VDAEETLSQPVKRRILVYEWFPLDIAKLVMLAIPALGVNHLLFGITFPISQGPWSAAVVLLPILTAALVLYGLLRRDRPTALGRSYLAFFLLYCLAFSIAAGSDLLTGPRRLLAGYDEDEGLPGNFLSLNPLGDWHYWWVPPAPPPLDLIILAVPSFAGQPRAEQRHLFASLIRRAMDHEALGIAFDYYFEDEAQVDALLRLSITSAESRGLPVLFGYRHFVGEGLVTRRPLPETLASVVSPERQGHLSGYLELDGCVRMVPVDLPGVQGQRALSYRIATVLHGSDVKIPQRRLVQFIAPRGGVPVVAVDPATPNYKWELMRDRFVLVGPADASDVVRTPFGELPGVVIHAYAAHSLRTGHRIRRLDPRWTFPMIFALCYALTLLQVQGSPRRTLFFAAAILSLVVFITAALAIRFGLLWMDVIYPLLAIWFLTALFLMGATIRTPTSQWSANSDSRTEKPLYSSAAGQKTADRASFDVFLCHNGKHRMQVRHLAKALQARGLRPWLDELELIPGRPWQEAREEAIETVRSSAILIGTDGLGPWEVSEMRGSLAECVKRGIPVIPVLLPGAPIRPILPLFLAQYTWVDLRGGLSNEGLDRLEWGITGAKPTYCPPL
jgi:hypothetical protein